LKIAMTAPEPRFDFHIRIEDERLDALDALVREFHPYVIRLGRVLPAGARYELQLLVSAELRQRLEQSGRKIQEVARINQAADLKRQVSQIDRFADDLKRLKREPR